MKKILTFIFIGCLLISCLSLTGCSNEKDNEALFTEAEHLFNEHSLDYTYEKPNIAENGEKALYVDAVPGATHDDACILVVEFKNEEDSHLLYAKILNRISFMKALPDQYEVTAEQKEEGDIHSTNAYIKEIYSEDNIVSYGTIYTAVYGKYLVYALYVPDSYSNFIEDLEGIFFSVNAQSK